MNGIGPNSRFKDGKGREFLFQFLPKQVNCELFAFIMPYITKKKPPIGIKKFMVFQVARNISIGTSR